MHRCVAVVLALVPVSCAGPPADRSGSAIVTAVVDGDTIDVVVGAGRVERVRLIGVDTPETHHPERPVECLGPEAAARTAVLLPPGTPVLLERDREARDPYGRLLAYVRRATDGMFVNLVLLEEGLARPLTIAPNTAYRTLLGDAARRAARTGLGVWSACTG